MSWQAYIDGNLVGTGFISHGAIHGLDGSAWASSPGLTISPQEIKEIIGSFADPTGIRTNGLHANGQKYFALNCNDRSVYGKKESTGIICVKTKTCVLIGLYDENTQPGQATTVVERLADYLISVGYVSFYSLPFSKFSSDIPIIVPPPSYSNSVNSLFFK